MAGLLDMSLASRTNTDAGRHLDRHHLLERAAVWGQKHLPESRLQATVPPGGRRLMPFTSTPYFRTVTVTDLLA